MANRQGSEMSTSVYDTTQAPPYWNGLALSACMHTVVVGIVLFFSQQLSIPQKTERNPIAVAFVTPQPTHTTPTHLQTRKKSPPTPTLTPKQVQTEVIPREPTQSKPHAQTQPRQKVSPQTVVQAPPKPAPLPKVQVTNATPMSMAQPKTVRNGVISSQLVSQPVSHTPTAQPTTVPQKASQPTVSSGVIVSQPIPEHTGVTRQHTAAKMHASPSRKKPIHVEATTDKMDPVTPRDPVIRNHVTNVPRPMASPVRSTPLRQSMTTPVRQSVNTLSSHVEKRVHVPSTTVVKPHVTNGTSYTAVRHVASKRARQQVSLSLGSSVVQTRATVNYTRQTRKARLTTTSRSASTNRDVPDLTIFKKLLLEKVSRALEYPRLARRLGYSGTTLVAVALSKTGIVRNLKVSQPSGYEILDKAAIKALQKALQTTKPPASIEIEFNIPIGFDLKNP